MAGLRVQGLGLRVQGLGFRLVVWGLGFESFFSDEVARVWC